MTYYLIFRKHTSDKSGVYKTVIGFIDNPTYVQMYINSTQFDIDIEQYDIDSRIEDLSAIAEIISDKAGIHVDEYDHLYISISQDGKEFLLWSNNNQKEFDENFIVSDYFHDYLHAAIALQTLSLLFNKDIGIEITNDLNIIMHKYIIPLISLDLTSGENVIIKQMGIFEDASNEDVYSIIDRVKFINRIYCT